MAFDLVTFTAGGLEEKAKNELRLCNDYLKRYGEGIVLSEKDITMLVESRGHALRSTGRIEFGGGSLTELAKAFCDSPNIQKTDFATVLAELLDIFYAYKNETDYKISDGELIEAMRIAFDGSCHGSTELLASIGARRILATAKYGYETELSPEDAPLDTEGENAE